MLVNGLEGIFFEQEGSDSTGDANWIASAGGDGSVLGLVFVLHTGYTSWGILARGHIKRSCFGRRILGYHWILRTAIRQRFHLFPDDLVFRTHGVRNHYKVFYSEPE